MAKRCTKEEFIQKSRSIHGDKYDYSKVNYINNSTSVIITCPEHGDFTMLPKTHTSIKSGCPACKAKTTKRYHKMNTQLFIQRAVKIHHDKYDYSKVKYVNMRTHVEIICPIHGSFLQAPDNHLNQRSGCPACGRLRTIQKRTRTFPELLKEFRRVHGERYDYPMKINLGYKNKIDIICKKHGLFRQEVGVHLRGGGCPKCKMSHGEEKIMLWLERHNIKYEYQKKFDGCKNIMQLPFDFYIPSINTCIEFQGEHHYKEIPYFAQNKRHQLSEWQKRDKIKKDFCKNNKIYLYEIKYDDNCENKLKKLFKGVNND